MWVQSLDQLLEEALRSLYRAWEELPRRSTVPALNRLRLALADQLAALPRPVDRRAGETALIDFAAAARRLPRVEEAGGAALIALAEATPVPATETATGAGAEAGAAAFSAYRVAPATNVSPARLGELIDLLRLPNPPQALIQAMNYAPSQAAEVWEKVGAAVGPHLDRMPAAEREQVTAIAAAVMAEVNAAGDTLAMQAAFLKGLKALEDVPAVIRVAAAVFFSSKYVGDPPILLVSKDAYAYTHAAAALPPQMEAAAEPPPAPTQPAQPEAVRVPFFADVRFPAQVKRGEVQWLSVQLRLEASAESRAQATVAVPFEATPAGELPPPAIVEVRLLAPDFREQTGVWERTITVYSSRDSQPAVFLLSGDVLGRKRITVDFYHKGRMIASLHFDSEVVQSATLRGGGSMVPAEALEMGTLAADPPPPADLELRVAYLAESNKLSFVLNSALPDGAGGGALGGARASQPVGQIKLNAKDPQSFFSDRLQTLVELARGAPVDAAAEERSKLVEEIEVLGEGLFEEMLPPDLQQIYWEQIAPLIAAGKVKTLLINSDEPWIPWELIKPYRYNRSDGSEQSGPFLVEQLAVSRWLARPLPLPVTVKQAALVMPDTNLPYVQEEKQFFEGLAQERNIGLQGPLAGHDEVLNSLRTGGFQLLHFATHGAFNAQDADRSELMLGSQSLTPAELAARNLRGVRSGRPLVFLNACDSGKGDFTLVGSGGWAHTFFVQGDASAFVGALWEVSDDLAAEFSCTFYRGLADGQTLGEALRAARLHIRDQEPANPTWLAYALYGDPNGRVTFG